MLEGDGDGAEAREALEQDPLKFRLIEGAERRMAIEAVRELTHHERLAAGIEVANLRVLHKAVRDVGKEPDLSEKAQGLGVIGYGARQAEKAAIALEDGDPKAGQPEQVRCHQPDGAGPDDRDVVFSHRSGFCCGMFHRRFPLGKLMLHIYVRSTK